MLRKPFIPVLSLALLLVFPVTVSAENASVLLDKYGISVYDPVVEGAKLNLLEEEYYVTARKVNGNEMLATAYDVSNLYQEEVNLLADLDREIYALADRLKGIEQQMGQSKARDVAYILALDEEYRAVEAELTLKRQARQRFIKKETGAQPADSVATSEKEKRRMNDLSRQVDQQRDKYERSLNYPELGDITNFRSPLETPAELTSPFGVRLDPITREAMTFHRGLDLRAAEGTIVLAAFNGVVEEASVSSDIGNYVIIDHGYGIKTLYGHLSSYSVSKGQQVKQYEPIAKSGNTGDRSTGPHLHFGLYINGNAVDPARIVPTS
ncbi:M23 family metallopeptidase [Paenibacillus xylaniclasticus]|uniref:M23 family metallopeptidase n=1 Tax=Paenibacillus xylaniclasticus TaxID=588083 RepID=UPI0013DE7FA0|nr:MULTISPECIES: M23 family metallopeptidase [Paenibacillus]GFN30942.1 hypothetical protein PCURB6_12020 [Paenibacillus curdlanolyticus]